MKWNREAEQAGKRARVFCASLADVFEDHPAIDASGARARLFALIEATPMLDWQLLTKRPENMVRFAPASWAKAWPTNVWAGCTVEDQPSADKRIPHLLRVPAVVRFLSMEPLLGPVNLHPWLCKHGNPARPEQQMSSFCDAADVLHWIIIGGESGPKARPFDLAWARAIMKQADDAGCAVFMKQLGARPLIESRTPTDEDKTEYRAKRGRRGTLDAIETYLALTDSHGGDPSEWPADLQGRRAFPVARTP